MVPPCTLGEVTVTELIVTDVGGAVVGVVGAVVVVVVVVCVVVVRWSMRPWWACSRKADG